MAVHILDALSREGFEEILAVHDRESGLRAFLALHDTSAGPAFGGIRRFSYASEKSALLDCLRLALSMSHKCALAGVRGGGGKVVILDRPDLDLERAYRHLGARVERMGGRFYTGPDVGTGEEELGWVTATTRYATRTDDLGPGDLAEATCMGTFAGVSAGLRSLYGEEDWAQRTIVVQGLGKAGRGMARLFAERGARVLAADLEADRVQRAVDDLGVERLEPGSEYEVEADVFCPCAMGGVLHDLTIQRLGAKIVAGAANNVLAKARHGDRLHERGILYVPDFVINAGALIRGATFHLDGTPASNEEILGRVGEVAREILCRALEEDAPPARVAVDEAERRLALRRGTASTDEPTRPVTTS